MWEVIKERASRENKTWTYDVGRGKSWGNSERGMRRETLGDRVHAYATISFDYIIVFRPGGIIRVNKLHIFFYFTSPFLHDRPYPSSSHCRDSVVANSRRLFDLLSRHLISFLPPSFLRVKMYEIHEPGGSFRDNPFPTRERAESL